LEELAGLQYDEDPGVCASDFGAIRTAPLETSDFGVENMELTAEDESNPEFLVLYWRYPVFTE
jgi:hypothetical protein